MATKEQIKNAILLTAGNPESGAIKDLADAFADAVFEIDNPSDKQKRIVEIPEKR